MNVVGTPDLEAPLGAPLGLLSLQKDSSINSVPICSGGSGRPDVIVAGSDCLSSAGDSHSRSGAAAAAVGAEGDRDGCGVIKEY